MVVVRDVMLGPQVLVDQTLVFMTREEMQLHWVNISEKLA
jgi:hypothetical protein